jgi:heme-degrading monooxygenase HmoA
MIARTWRGSVRADDADGYLAYLRSTGLAAYRSTAGHLGTLGLRRAVDGTVEYLLVTLWSSSDAIRGFAGEDVDRAVFYPEDDRYLVKREKRVGHFEAVFLDGPGLALLSGARASAEPDRAAAGSAEPDRHAAAGASGERGWWWRGWVRYAASLAGSRGVGADLR